MTQSGQPSTETGVSSAESKGISTNGGAPVNSADNEKVGSGNVGNDVKGVSRLDGNLRVDNWSRLLERVGQHRDEAAFAQLFGHFAPLIKGFCLGNLNGNFPIDAAEEIVQEVMFKVWQKSPGYDATKSAASTWIYTVMRNCRIDLMRRNKRTPTDKDGIDIDDIWDEAAEDQAYVYLQQANDEALIHQSFTHLPPEQRQVLTQVYMQGKTHQQIALETGLPLGTVKSRVRIGLKKMQALIVGQRKNVGSEHD